MKWQEEVLREAIEKARGRGIVVNTGAIFDWTEPGPDGVPIRNRSEAPSSCDATGAVLLMMGRPGLTPGWMKALCDYMQVDGFWLWRFWMGWNRNYQVQVLVREGDKERWADDEVSHFGRRLAKELDCRGQVHSHPRSGVEEP